MLSYIVVNTYITPIIFDKTERNIERGNDKTERKGDSYFNGFFFAFGFGSAGIVALMSAVK